MTDLACPPRSDPGYLRTYQRLRYRADPAYRAAVIAKSRARNRRIAAENAEGRRWRRRSVERALAVLFAAGWDCARIAAGCGVHRQAVYHWRAGRSLPSEANAAALSRLAGTVDG